MGVSELVPAAATPIVNHAGPDAAAKADGATGWSSPIRPSVGRGGVERAGSCSRWLGRKGLSQQRILRLHEWREVTGLTVRAAPWIVIGAALIRLVVRMTLTPVQSSPGRPGSPRGDDRVAAHRYPHAVRRPWASSDVLVAAVAVLVGQAEMWAPRFMQSQGNLHVVGPKWVNVPAFLISGLALLWRRRAPMAVLAVVVATGTIQVLAVGATEGLGWYLPLLIALYSVARNCDTWPASIGLALALAGMAVHDLRDPRITGWTDVSLF